MQTCGCESIHRDNRPTTLFQFGGIRFLGEKTVWWSTIVKTVLIRNEDRMYACVRCYYYN